MMSCISIAVVNRAGILARWRRISPLGVWDDIVAAVLFMRILHKHDDGARKVRVYQSTLDGARFYYEGSALYTQVDGNGKNRLKYITMMGELLAERHDVLMLGTAGGALATKISRRGGQVTAVDCWDGAFDVARRWFQLPDEVECVHADALDFLRTTARQWDGVAIDVFRGGEIPSAMFAGDIGLLLAKVLRPGGVAVWNVADHPLSWPSERVVAALKRAGFKTALTPVLDTDGDNTLIVGHQQPSRL
ncbi:spermidine synthase [Caulobacter sp. LjRoot300]|uniref:spermidine synthase n=1 Tax=Caulobacter sp. LjRoot300 TaxID=3342321 RepID=UPI003ECF60AD